MDAQFRKASFNPDRIFEVHGDYGLMQCGHGCHLKLYSDKETVEQIVKHSHKLTVSPQYVPVCPACGGNMDVHVRKNQFFIQEQNWKKAADSYEKFIARYAQTANVVLLELG